MSEPRGVAREAIFQHKGPRKNVGVRLSADVLLTLELVASMRGMSRHEYLVEILTARAEQDLRESLPSLDEIAAEKARRSK